jgi:Ca2+-binding RTX toxin-like protein
VSARALAADSTRLFIDGEAGNDTLVGSAGADRFDGGDANDSVTGGQGTDVALLGAGDDTFTWNPGVGSDVVEGQEGHDTMVFNGTNTNDRIEVSANGQRARLTRDVGNITMDMNGLETLDVNALGGADTVTVDDLTGTDMTKVSTELGSQGADDGFADQLIVNGTDGNDAIVASGLAAQTIHPTLDGGDGADVWWAARATTPCSAEPVTTC